MTKDESKICYVLESFPQISETFISEEAFSMMILGVKTFVITFNLNDKNKKLHPSARYIIENCIIYTIANVTKKQILKSFIKIFFLLPFRTTRVLFVALTSKHRWSYFNSVPYSLKLLENNISFIHAHFASENLIWTSALSEWTGIPFGVTTHRYDLLDDPIPVAVASEMFYKADLVVTISNYNKNLMANKYSIPDEKIKVIHCGIDTETFRRKGNRPKFKDKSLSILNVGRLVPEKGQDILIQALSIVLERGLSFNLKIVGDGPQEKKLTDLVKSCGIEDKVIFMGAQTQENILEMLEEADVFILPSRSEGLPVVCMEAMAMEVFLIASRISGIPELVSDKINGLLIDPDDVDGLADAILWVNQNREELMKMTKTARKKIEKNFNRVNCTKELLAAMNI